MIRTRPFAELAAQVNGDPVRRELVEIMKGAMRDALTIAELREQWSGAEANISRIEHEEGIYLATLREYIVELGGELEVNAVFPDGEVTLVPVGE